MVFGVPSDLSVSQLVGREPPGRLLVTDAELCEAIPESFAAVGEAEYQDILDD